MIMNRLCGISARIQSFQRKELLGGYVDCEQFNSSIASQYIALTAVKTALYIGFSRPR